MEIPFAKPYFPDHDIDIVLIKIRHILESGWLTSGPEVEAFEADFAEFIGNDYAIAVNSGTAALHSIIMALDIGYRDEVIVPANTFVATANVVTYVHGNPIFADCHKDTFNILLDSIESELTDKTKAIIPVHLGGNPCQMDELIDFAVDKNILLIEDCAHAIGSRYQNRNCGSFGIANAFSFYPTKVMTTCEGGMVTTNDKDIADRIRRIRNQGRGGYGPLEITELGYNYRMPDILAVIGRSQLPRVPYFIARRRRIADGYNNVIRRIPWLKPQKVSQLDICPYYAYIVNLVAGAPMTRDELVAKLKQKGINTSILYHSAAEQPLYKSVWNCPIASELGKTSFALPMYYDMSGQEEDYIHEQLEAICLG